MGLRSSDPIAKLELTIRVGEHQRKLSRMVPEFANVRVLQDQNDAGWAGEVDGEVLNTAHAQTLTGTHLSVVLLDAGGNVVGGGNGGASGALPSASRMGFVANSGFTARPFEPAVPPRVSGAPSYAV